MSSVRRWIQSAASVLVVIQAAATLPCVAAGADPSTFEYRKARAAKLLADSDYQAALEAAQSVHRDWMDDVAAYQLMAEAHLGLGDYQAADSDLQWMLDLREGKADANGWYLISRLREATGDADGAIEAMRAAIDRLTPGDTNRNPAAMLAWTGHLYTLQGRFDAAAVMLQRALDAAPDNARVLEASSRLKLAQGNRDSALETAQRCADVSHDLDCLYLQGQLTGQYSAFEKAARSRLDTPANANRGLVFFLVGPAKRPEEALTIAQREASRRHDIGTLDALAVAQMANGQIDNARNTIRKALASGTRDSEVLRHASEMGVTAP